MTNESVNNPFIYIWEYVVDASAAAEFRRIYGPTGEWVQLFAQADGFIKTELLEDVNYPNRFVTIDRWTSKAARDSFRREFATEFAALDAGCAALTLEERFVGDFQFLQH